MKRERERERLSLGSVVVVVFFFFFFYIIIIIVKVRAQNCILGLRLCLRMLIGPRTNENSEGVKLKVS